MNCLVILFSIYFEFIETEEEEVVNNIIQVLFSCSKFFEQNFGGLAAHNFFS